MKNDLGTSLKGSDHIPSKKSEPIPDAGGKAVAIQADVTDLASVMAMVAKAENELGPIGILVNNAGATPSPDVHKPFCESGPKPWNSVRKVTGEYWSRVLVQANAG